MKEFVRESNRIEGMYHPPTDVEVEAHAEFLYELAGKSA